MEKIEAIKDFINNNLDEETGQVIKSDDYDSIYSLISYVNKKFDCNLEIQHAGGFESPGYDVDCYAWAGVINGKLYFDTLEIKRY